MPIVTPMLLALTTRVENVGRSVHGKNVLIRFNIQVKSSILLPAN